ncbi:MAG: hypothetical protein N2555_06410 [Endomicrobia bacterium]|nr:hypothetical protein [Endomicrobiia bacterium]
MLRLIIIFIIFLLCISCIPPKMLMEQAKRDEQNQRFDKAEQKYLTIIIKHNKSEYVPEAKYRLGLLYKDVKKDYLQARMWFNEIISRHPDSEYVKPAEVGILESPDYIGAIDGNIITIGDIESGGKNMRLATEFKKLDYNLYIGKYKLFAGEKVVKTYDRYYLKENGEIREYTVNPKTSTSKNYTVMIKYPVETNTSWTTQKDNKQVAYTIVAKDLQLKLQNKTFDGCIKVREYIKGEKGIRFIYYAPNKGCVRITTAMLDEPKEYTVMELIQ